MSSNENFKKPKKEVKKVISTKFDESVFKVSTEKQRNGQIIEELDFRPGFKTHHSKCMYRTCKEFDTSLEHLKQAAMELNYRKIDGVLFNHLIGRYGFYDGVQRNRVSIALEYKIPPMGVEIAEARLKEILSHSDTKKAYADYMDGYKKATSKKVDDHIRTGGSIDE